MLKTTITALILAIATISPAFPITPEQALDNYEQALENDLLSSPAASPKMPPAVEPTTITTEYIQPAKGVITSGYGWRWGRMHKGIDIAAPVGTPISASANGTVINAGWNSGGYGLLVEVRHDDGTITRYAHNSQILVSIGQAVVQGQAIALMGSTGYSTGSHCHFEIILAGKGAINPSL